MGPLGVDVAFRCPPISVLDMFSSTVGRDFIGSVERRNARMGLKLAQSSILNGQDLSQWER